MQILNLKKKPLIDVKIILKIHLQQKQVNIFHQVFQCLQDHHLKAYKISMLHINIKIS